MSADKGGPRDWDKELADIDKLIAAGPSAAPSQVPAKGRAAAGPPAGARREAGAGAAGVGTRHHVATWVWFSLAGLLGVGLTFLWPYERSCGMGLYAYVGSIGAFGLAAMWSTIWSWRTRAAAVHFLSIGLLGWSAALGAREVLPRIGYARQRASWECRAGVPTQPTRPTPQ